MPQLVAVTISILPDLRKGSHGTLALMSSSAVSLGETEVSYLPNLQSARCCSVTSWCRSKAAEGQRESFWTQTWQEKDF